MRLGHDSHVCLPSGSFISLFFSLSSRRKKKFLEQVFWYHPFGSGGNGHISMHINSLLIHGTQVYSEDITDHLLTLHFLKWCPAMKLDHFANYVPSGSILASLSKAGTWTVIARIILPSHYIFLLTNARISGFEGNIFEPVFKSW